MNKMLISLMVVAISIAFVSVAPAAQAWQEHGKLIGMQVYGEHMISGKPIGASAPMMGQFEASSEFTGKLPSIYYREKYPDLVPL